MGKIINGSQHSLLSFVCACTSFLCLCKERNKPARTYRSVRAGKAQPISLPAGRQGCGSFLPSTFTRPIPMAIGTAVIDGTLSNTFSRTTKQDGMNTLCRALDAEGGTKMNYARVLDVEFKLIHRKRSARSQSYFRSRYRNCQAHPLGIEGSTQFIIDVRQALQPEVFGGVL